MPPHIIEKAKEAAKRTLEDIDVRMFLEQYDLAEDADFIQRNMSQFREYIKVRDTDEWYSANLKIYDHNVMVEYIPRNERLAFRLMSGHSLVAKAHYDATTESFRDATMARKTRTSTTQRPTPTLRDSSMPIAKASTAKVCGW